MLCKGIIFDLDGTLLDTLDDIADAANRVLEQAGLPTHPIERYKYFVGNGVQALIDKILPENKKNAEQIKGLLMAFRQDYGKNWQVKTQLYDGISDMLSELQKMRIPMNVLSNKPHEFTRLCVEEFLSKWAFKEVWGQREEFPRKPDPASALAIAQIMEAKPEEILYLGDTATDMQTACSAGMVPVGALWGFRTENELLEHGAQFVIDHPLDLLDLLDTEV